MNILSIDGGASQTRGVIFSPSGVVHIFRSTEPTSLSRPGGVSIEVLKHFIPAMTEEAGLKLPDVDLICLGLAGTSNEAARESLFKEMNTLDVGRRLVITSDAEAAFESVWGAEPGALISVGTGAIGWARDEQGITYRAAGRGPQLGGDPGSGYWLGKTLLVRLIMREADADPELDTMRQVVIDHYQAANFEDAARLAGESADDIHILSGLGRPICEEAEKGNQIALAILQEGSMTLAEEILDMLDRAGLKREVMTLGMNGSILVRNRIFRQQLAEAMLYEVPEIDWKGPDLDPAFGAGLLAARLQDISPDKEALKASWAGLDVPALG